MNGRGKSVTLRPFPLIPMTDDTLAIGSRVRIIWPSTRDGLSGIVTGIEGRTIYVRIDGERWQCITPIPVRRGEIRVLSPTL